MMGYYSSDITTTWDCWSNSTISTTTTCSTVSSVIWATWTGSSSTAASGTITIDNNWGGWIKMYETEQSVKGAGQHYDKLEYNSYVIPETFEDMIQRLEQDIERDVKYAYNCKKEALRKQQAEKRAKNLLMSVLNQKQLEAFLRDECIPVDTAKGNKYIIHKGRTKNIDIIGKDGVRLHKLCVHPADNVPDYDTMLAQLMYLRMDEEALLQIANKHYC